MCSRHLCPCAESHPAINSAKRCQAPLLDTGLLMGGTITLVTMAERRARHHLLCRHHFRHHFISRRKGIPILRGITVSSPPLHDSSPTKRYVGGKDKEESSWICRSHRRSVVWRSWCSRCRCLPALAPSTEPARKSRFTPIRLEPCNCRRPVGDNTRSAESS